MWNMHFEFVYIGYSHKQCDFFVREIAQKLCDKRIDFKYDKQHFAIQCEIFRLVGVPIHTGTICNLGIENADYVVEESAYPDYKASLKEYLFISEVLDYISTRFRKNTKEKTEKELEELIDILIECLEKGVRNEKEKSGRTADGRK